MLRTLLTAIGLVELLSPERFIETAERLALENPDECEMKSWVVPVARLEGLTFLFMMWRSDDSYASFRKFLGVIGVLALFYPRTYVDVGSKLAYDDAETCSWKPWVYPVTRLVGLVYVIIALSELKRGRAGESQS